MTIETAKRQFPSRIETIAGATAAVIKEAESFGFSGEALDGIDMAVREAVTNAVLHGNKQDATKTVNVIVERNSDSFVVAVQDEGEGFNPSDVPDPTDEQNLLKASGRGMLFMRAFMDEVEWTKHPAGGTIVRMTKRK
ncbi:MAG: ATP-binding protein [Pyrinomonadaceae bacterium]|nr:ATP-binding protein [Pyrinomonadaceae bacterium]